MHSSLLFHFLHSSQLGSSVSFWGIPLPNNERRNGKEIEEKMCTKAVGGKYQGKGAFAGGKA